MKFLRPNRYNITIAILFFILMPAPNLDYCPAGYQAACMNWIPFSGAGYLIEFIKGLHRAYSGLYTQNLFKALPWIIGFLLLSYIASLVTIAFFDYVLRPSIFWLGQVFKSVKKWGKRNKWLYKYALVVLITAIVVGGGVYVWIAMKYVPIARIDDWREDTFDFPAPVPIEISKEEIGGIKLRFRTSYQKGEKTISLNINASRMNEAVAYCDANGNYTYSNRVLTISITGASCETFGLLSGSGPRDGSVASGNLRELDEEVLNDLRGRYELVLELNGKEDRFVVTMLEDEILIDTISATFTALDAEHYVIPPKNMFLLRCSWYRGCENVDDFINEIGARPFELRTGEVYSDYFVNMYFETGFTEGENPRYYEYPARFSVAELRELYYKDYVKETYNVRPDISFLDD